MVLAIITSVAVACTASTAGPSGSAPPPVATDDGSIQPSTPPPAVGLHLPGFDRTVCGVTRTKADLGLSGVGRDRAYVFSLERASECESSRAFVAVAPQGSDVIAVSTKAITCHPRCRIIATPDVDHDGVAEVAVGQRALWSFFYLFGVDRQAGATVEPFRRETGTAMTFGVGGSTQSMFGLVCGPGRKLTSWGAAETQEGAGPYDVRVKSYRLVRSTLVRIASHHATVAQGDSALLPEAGGVAFGESFGICGTKLLTVSDVSPEKRRAGQ